MSLQDTRDAFPPLLALPPELIRTVLMFLPLEDLSVALRVCTAFHAHSTTDSFWHEMSRTHSTLNSARLTEKVLLAQRARLLLPHQGETPSWKNTVRLMWECGLGTVMLGKPLCDSDSVCRLPFSVSVQVVALGCSEFRIRSELLERDDAFALSCFDIGVSVPSDFVDRSFHFLDGRPTLNKNRLEWLLRKSYSHCQLPEPEVERQVEAVLGCEVFCSGMRFPRSDQDLSVCVENALGSRERLYPHTHGSLLALFIDLHSPSSLSSVDAELVRLILANPDKIFVPVIVGWSRRMKSREEIREFREMVQLVDPFGDLVYGFPEDFLDEDLANLEREMTEEEGEEEEEEVVVVVEETPEEVVQVRAECLRLSSLLQAPYFDLFGLSQDEYNHTLKHLIPQTILYRCLVRLMVKSQPRMQVVEPIRYHRENRLCVVM